jgi:hypothetical protein
MFIISGFAVSGYLLFIKTRLWPGGGEIHIFVFRAECPKSDPINLCPS